MFVLTFVFAGLLVTCDSRADDTSQSRNYELHLDNTSQSRNYELHSLRQLIGIETRNRGLTVEGDRERLYRFLDISRAPWPIVTDRTLVANHLLLRSDLPLGLASYPILLIPVAAARERCFVLIHAGHGTQLQDNLDIATSHALVAGCHVMLFEMPRVGSSGFVSSDANRNPSLATLPDGTSFDFTPFSLHEAFAELESITGMKLLAVFIQPVVDAVSWIIKHYPTSRIFMLGLSGGAWTTHLAAAVDPRIHWSMAVAGSDPIESAAYDYERRHPSLTRDFGYSRIYLLAGSNRRPHYHIYNRRDSCCFRPPDDLATIMREMSQLSQVMGIESGYTVMVDESASTHEVGPDSLQIFLEALSGQ